MECVLSVQPPEPGAGLLHQPLLVLLPMATHPTWSEASTPLRRSKLGKVDEALSFSVSVSFIHVFTPDRPFFLNIAQIKCSQVTRRVASVN